MEYRRMSDQEIADPIILDQLPPRIGEIKRRKFESEAVHFSPV